MKDENNVEQFEILFGENFRGSERVKKICKLNSFNHVSIFLFIIAHLSRRNCQQH